ncbi:MAG TPA: hypothetical protein VEA58_13810 [Anaerovoracaceae bacterium]|nr:hypothetical protein [Anaerovoracaceae bacterium]
MKKTGNTLISILILSLILCSCSPDSTEKVSKGKSDDFTLLEELRSKPIEGNSFVQVGELGEIDGDINTFDYFPIDETEMIYLLKDSSGSVSGIYQSRGKQRIDGYGESYCVAQIQYNNFYINNQYSQYADQDSKKNISEVIRCYDMNENGDIVRIGEVKDGVFTELDTPSYLLPQKLNQDYKMEEVSDGIHQVLGIADVTINNTTYPDCLVFENGSVQGSGGTVSAVSDITYYAKNMGPVYYEFRSNKIKEKEDYTSSFSYIDNEPGAAVSLYDALKKLKSLGDLTDYKIEYKWSQNIDAHLYYVFWILNDTNSESYVYLINQTDLGVYEATGADEQGRYLLN